MLFAAWLTPHGKSMVEERFVEEFSGGSLRKVRFDLYM